MESSESSLPVQWGAIDIPDDLWIEILARVPALVVRKFRRLSKFHRDLIDSSNFINKHSNLSHKTSSSCGYLIFGSDGFLSDESEDYYLKKFDDKIALHRLNPPNNDNKYKCWGSCKGIMLLRSPESLMLWNPFTGATSPELMMGPSELMMVYYYLGYDEVDDDLKILMTKSSEFGLPLSVRDCEIYSSKSGCWRKVMETNHQLDVFLYASQVFLEDTYSVYILGKDLNTDDYVIISFDFSTEKFNQRIILPREMFRWGSVEFCKFSSFNGCLCISTLHRDDERIWDLWLMEEESNWVHVLSFGPSEDLIDTFKKPLEFVNDGREFLFLSANGVHLYDLKEAKMKDEVTVDFEDECLSFGYRSFTYDPSLR